MRTHAPHHYQCFPSPVAAVREPQTLPRPCPQSLVPAPCPYFPAARFFFHSLKKSSRFFGSRYVTISELTGIGFTTFAPSSLSSEAAVYSALTSLRIANSSTSLPISFCPRCDRM